MSALRQFPIPQTATPKNILLVDDTPANLQVLTLMLKEQGYQVRNALNGAMALMACDRQPPDLIILDIMMPQMNGYQLCQQLKNSPLTTAIPIIFISALDQASDKIMGFQVGGADYITKPFQAEEVLVRVKYQLLLQNMQDQLQQQNLLLEKQNIQLQDEIKRRKRIEIALAQANQRFRQLASQDGLTGIANRRHFDKYLGQEWHRANRAGQPLSLILSDVDCFKAYNDTYGHPAGDVCLTRIAEAISQALKRPADLVFRYGGEEFAVILPNTDVAGAVQVAQEIQQQVRSLDIPHNTSMVDQYITLSMGIYSLSPPLEAPMINLLNATDQALYQAKKTGRNRYCIYNPALSSKISETGK